MICNYENITDYCSNRYSYFFNDVIASGTIVAVDDSEFAPVLRVDNITGQTKLLTQYSTDTIPTCNSTDDSEGTNDWECYTIFRYIAQGSIGDPPFGVFQEAQKQIIKEAYNTSSQDGVYVTINSQTVLLGANISDQIAYKSILSYAQALYDDDTDATMPSFTDVNGTIYNLSYTDLVAAFKTYFTKLVYYKNLQDTLLNEIDKCETVFDLQQLNWCGTKPLTGDLQPTEYSSQPLPAQVSVVNCGDIEIDTQPTEDNTPIPCDSDSDCNSFCVNVVTAYGCYCTEANIVGCGFQPGQSVEAECEASGGTFVPGSPCYCYIIKAGETQESCSSTTSGLPTWNGTGEWMSEECCNGTCYKPWSNPCS